MKLILLNFSVHSEHTNIIPIEAESIESVIRKLQRKAVDTSLNNEYSFELFGHRWQVDDFYTSNKLTKPIIYTLEEWFERDKVSV